MAFDPDKFISSKDSTGSFDPDKFIGEEKGGLFAGAMKALDYAAGIGRTAAQRTPQVVLQKLMARGIPETTEGVIEDITGKEAWMRALKGEADPSKKGLLEMGVPESVKVRGMDVPVAGPLGFATDVVADPSIGLSKIKAGTKLGKTLLGLLNPMETAFSGAGKVAYRSGLKKADQAVKAKGKKAVSEVLLKYGAPTGSAETISRKSGNIANKLFGERESLLKAADDAGQTVDMGKAMDTVYDDALKMIDTKDPIAMEYGELLAKVADRYRDVGKVSASQASQMKTNLYNALPDSVWGKMKATSPGNEALGKVSKAIKEATEEAVEQATGRGKQLMSVNDELGTLLTGRRAMSQEAAKEVNKRYVTAIDAMIAGSGNWAMLTTKKTSDIAFSTAGRTITGKVLMTPGVPGAAKRGIINLGQGE